MEWTWEHWCTLVVWTYVWHNWVADAWCHVWDWVKGLWH